VAAGVTYTVGAVLFALGRPNPLPRWYGYHEVWHTLGVAAGAIFFVAILPLVQAG
jgi:hemolysin III